MKQDEVHLRPPNPTPSFSRTRGLLSSAPAVAAFFFVFGCSLGMSSSFTSSTTADTNSVTTTVLSPLLVKENVVLETSPQQQQPPPPNDLLRFRTKCAPPIPQSHHLPTILSRVYNNTSPYADFPSSEISSLLLPPPRRLRGWGSTMSVFADLIDTVRPLTIIELGTFLGASALHMASLTRNLSLPSLIVCLDDFRGWPGFRSKFSRDIPL